MHHLGLHHAEKEVGKGRGHAFDRVMIVVGILGPLALIPQVITIWSDKNVAGVSLLSWVLLTAASVMWLFYGIFHNAKALMVSNTLSIIFTTLIVIGVLMVR